MHGKKIIHHPAGEPDASRRGFLRKAGLASAVAAAFAGGADVLGVTRASADTCPCFWACTTSSCACAGVSHAGSNGCCDPGYCCYHCVLTPSRCGGGSLHACITRSSHHCAGFDSCTRP
jgi:hypothetical protein